MAKQMTAAYRNVFIVTVLFAFLCLVFGTINGRIGMSFLVWAYLAWLTYKRESKKLVSYFNIIFIIMIIAAGMCVVLNLIYPDMDKYSLGLDRLVDCLLVIGLAYWLKNFHAKQK
jgi:branched-subunit amino acid transport protein AzlD